MGVEWSGEVRVGWETKEFTRWKMQDELKTRRSCDEALLELEVARDA